MCQILRVMRSIELRKTTVTDNISDYFCYNCCFCGRFTNVSSTNSQTLKCLNNNDLYCVFCLRHRYIKPRSNHVLMISFRNVIKWYYEYLYCQERLIYLLEIKDMIQKHQDVGLSNPVLNYDPSNFLWFIDFNDVERKNPSLIQEISNTMKNCFRCFEIKSHLDVETYWKPLKSSIENFYSRRVLSKKVLEPKIHVENLVADDFTIDDLSVI